MLQRVLEPEVMATPEDALQYDAMDHRQVNQQFVADFLQVVRPGSTESFANAEPVTSEADDSENNDLDAVRPLVLDLGTGTALIPIELCQQWSEARVMAVDDSIAMLDQARINVELSGLRDSIMLQRADCKQLIYDAQNFQAVISNTLLHHIPEPESVLSEAWRVLAPGGWLFIRDLIRPASAAEVAALVDLHAAGQNDFQRQLLADSLHAALTLAEIHSLVESVGITGGTVQQTSDRHWTLIAQKPSL